VTLRAPQPGTGTAQALLFERLLDAGPGAGGAGTAADLRTAMQASVAREIGGLLATRIDPSVDAIEPSDRTVLDFGLPDISALSPRSSADRERIARSIERAIRAFEPRLTDPVVAVLEELVEHDALTCIISGTLTVNAVPETYAFPMGVGIGGNASGR
jgi:type VI secretion system protein ImpF